MRDKQKENDLLSKHQRMQKGCKEKKCLKDACVCEMEKSQTRDHRKRNSFSRARAEVAEQAGEDRRGSCASQSNGCCFDSVLVEQLFALGAAHARQPIQALQDEFSRRLDGLHQAPATQVHTSGGERGNEFEEEQEQRAASCQMGPPAPGGRNQGFPAGSVFDPARYQNAIGESGGGNLNSPRNGPYNRDSSRTTRKHQQPRMESFEGEWKKKEVNQETKRRNSQSMNLRTPEGSSLKGCPSTSSLASETEKIRVLEENSTKGRGKDCTNERQKERWRVEEKRKGGKLKKTKKKK